MIPTTIPGRCLVCRQDGKYKGLDGHPYCGLHLRLNDVEYLQRKSRDLKDELVAAVLEGEFCRPLALEIEALDKEFVRLRGLSNTAYNKERTR